MKLGIKYLLFLSAIFFVFNCTLSFAESTNAATGTTDDLAILISNPNATFNNTSFIFTFQVTTPQTYYRAYIDTTRNPSTGYPVAKLGAKYLLQNGYLYSYVGPGWTWKRVKAVTFSVTNNTVTWTVGRTDMGNMNCAGAFDYAYQVVTGTITSASPKATLCYTSDTSCVVPVPAKQKVALPAYFYPDCASNSNCYWKQIDNSIPKVGVVVINPNDGPGKSPDANYMQQVKHTQTMGGVVLGYVSTNHSARNLSSIESDIDKYFNWYHVDGIFFDTGSATDCNMLSYYQTLNQYVKAKGGRGLTAVKFGTDAPECYIEASDILVNYEDTYSNYLNWKPAQWVYKYPENKFWHIVHKTSQRSIENAVILAKMHNAGWVYVTPDAQPHPYDSLPSMTYWNMELDALT